MSGDQTRSMIVAIGSNDDFIHAYEDEQALLQDHTIGAGKGELSGPLEFFDTAGHRLTGVYDRKWRLLCLKPTADRPDPDLLRQRVQNAFEHLRLQIKNLPDTTAVLSLKAGQALSLIPDLSGPEDLEETLRYMFAAHWRPNESELTPAHMTSNPVHNFSHFAGWRS